MLNNNGTSDSMILLIHILLLSLFLFPLTSATDADDLDVLDELLAIDDEVELSSPPPPFASAQPIAHMEAEVLSRAQRVVRDLTNENAKELIDGKDAVLLLGYAPWCPRSAELMPRFAEAAMRLWEMGSPVVVAKLDADRYGKSAALLGVHGFPTVLLFVNGTSHSYTGGFTWEELVIWVRKKTGAPVIRLSSISAAEEFAKMYHTYVIGYLEDYKGPGYEEFVKAAISNNEIQFAEANDISVAKILFPQTGSGKYFVGLVKNEPERYANYDGIFDEKKILTFIEYNKFPLVTPLTEINSARVYSSSIKLQLFIFFKNDELKDFLLPLQEVARKFKTKMMFIYVDSADDNLARPTLSLFGLEPERPIVTAFDNNSGSKYLLESDITINNIEEFCFRLLHGTLLPYYKSEPVPESSGIVEKVVGRTFDDSVLGSSKNVFLEVSTPWCFDCEARSKQVEKLAKHFKAQGNLKFARIDASANEHPKLQVDNYPAILFYPAADKLNPKKISNKSSSKELKDFINTNARSEEGGFATDSTKKDEL